MFIFIRMLVFPLSLCELKDANLPIFSVSHMSKVLRQLVAIFYTEIIGFLQGSNYVIAILDAKIVFQHVIMYYCMYLYILD